MAEMNLVNPLQLEPSKVFGKLKSVQTAFFKENIQTASKKDVYNFKTNNGNLQWN